MADERTFVARWACPGCGVQAPRRVIAREKLRGPGRISWEARVHDCPACFTRRALALAAARERLRAEGSLGESPRHRLTWLGQALREEGHDPLAGAILSELLRAGARCRAGATLRLAAQESEVPAPAGGRGGGLRS